jgi:hypothetical protein
MAISQANQAVMTFGLSNFKCGTQEAASDRARRPEFTKRKVAMTQGHQLIGRTHRRGLLDMKEIMGSRNVGMEKMVMPQEKLLLGWSKVGVTSMKAAMSPNSFVGGSTGRGATSHIPT